MAYKYTIPNMTEGVDQALVGIAEQVPSFPIMILVFIWGVVFLGGVMKQKQRLGYADFPMWTTMASFSCLVVSLLMSVREGFITLQVLSIVVVVTIFSAVWLFLSKGRLEQ